LETEAGPWAHEETLPTKQGDAMAALMPVAMNTGCAVASGAVRAPRHSGVPRKKRREGKARLCFEARATLQLIDTRGARCVGGASGEQAAREASCRLPTTTTASLCPAQGAP